MLRKHSEGVSPYKWTKLMQILEATGIDRGKSSLISMLCMDQNVKLKVDQGETRSVKIGRGVRQGCCLSPIMLTVWHRSFTFNSNKSPT